MLWGASGPHFRASERHFVMLVVPHFVPKPYLYSLLLSSSLFFSLLLSSSLYCRFDIPTTAAARLQPKSPPQGPGSRAKNGHSFPSIKQASRSHAARTLELHALRDTVLALLSRLFPPGPRVQGPGSKKAIVSPLSKRHRGNAPLALSTYIRFAILLQLSSLFSLPPQAPGPRVQDPGSRV